MSVVVVGAGPAGAATAIALRRRGRAVTLLDRARFPRDKVCGDVLLPESLAAMKELGLDLAALERRAYRCTGARYVTPAGREVSGEFFGERGASRPWWMVKRAVLDAWLVACARDAGADVRDGTAVTGVIKDGERAVGVNVARGAASIAADVVVGADGASSSIARAVGAFDTPPDHTCLATRAYARGVTLPAPYLEVITTRETLPGCAWIVPVSATEVNVGLGILKRTSIARGTTPAALFAAVVRDVPLLAERLRGATLSEMRGWSLPGAGIARRRSGPGWLLVGDAGAMIDPFTGHGIHHALVAGRIAAATIDDALSRGDVSAAALAGYDRACDATFAREVSLGGLLQRAHASPAFVGAAAWLCRAHPGLRDTFFALVGHAAPRRELLSPMSLVRASVRTRSWGTA